MADDSDVVVAFRADLTDMDQAFSTVEKKVGNVGVQLEGAGKKGESFLGAFGGEGRHLRLLSMELGNMEGAGQLASRGMFSALGAARALNIGLDTMGGGIGIAIAAIGLIVTAFASWREAAKKTREEQEALYKATLKGTDDIAKGYADANDEVVKYMNNERRRKDLEAEQEVLARRRSELRKAGFKDNNEEMIQLAHLNRLIEADIASIRNYGMTVAEARKKATEADEKEWKALQELNDLNAKDAEETLKRNEDIAKSYEELSKRGGVALVSLLHSHENFFKGL